MLETALLLGIDTCGPSGSVALGRVAAGKLEILGQTELAGRSYSATLVAAVGELLAGAEAGLRELHAIVVVNGPGSFTGIRVGVSAVKGFAEGTDLRVIAISRLEALAGKSGVLSSALDAHRGEVFLRVASATAEGRELLAGMRELAAIDTPPERIAVCDESAAALLSAAWPASELVRVDAPTAADALALFASRARTGPFADLALLDGHYLRRSDAEIFGTEPTGEPAAPRTQGR